MTIRTEGGTMVSTKDLIKEAKALRYSGSDIYVPNVKYPHLHINKDFVTYSTAANSHKYLIQGSTVRKNDAKSVLPSATNPHMKQLIQYIIDNA
jgi:hypothetical protein